MAPSLRVISGYEKVFKQDLDGDTFIGVNHALDDVLTDKFDIH